MLTLEDIKNYLNITWADDETGQKIKAAALRAQSTVGGLIGRPKAKFYGDEKETQSVSENGGEEEQLFLDACRYIYNEAYEDFRKNFADAITSLRAYNAVAKAGEDTDVKESSNI